MQDYETDYSFDECLKIVHDKLSAEMVTGKGRNTWINEEGAEVLKTALHIPEIVPKYHMGCVVRPAPNKGYVYAKLDEKDAVVPVVVPRRMRDTLLNKRIRVEEINDGNPSYRYVKEKLFS
jgi:hypothetical protein